MTRLGQLALVLVLAPAVALAQPKPKDVDTQRGPTRELYLSKRPLAPDAPVLSTELRQLLNSTEKARDDKRLEAIGLLRAFLDSKPTGDQRAEGVFKLAELLWEESRRLYLVRMDDYARAIEKCGQSKASCGETPKEPRIDLKEAEGYYRELHDKYPQFRRMDLVTYLMGFAAKEDGREPEAMEHFQEVIDRFPKSALYGDAWMMVGEHHFALGKWKEAKDAYVHVDASAATSDLAIFKTAWCEWKLGDTTAAATDFKRVLDKRYACKNQGAKCKRTANLAEEALEYLVVVFTEDRTLSAKEVFDFLVSIGGEQYSRDIMIKVAESYGGQGEWDRSNEAYRFLIKMEPEQISAAEYQRAIVTNWNSALQPESAQDEIKILLDLYGPTSAWAKSQKNRDAVARSLDNTEKLVRETALRLYVEAQRREKALKLAEPTEGCFTKPRLPADVLALFARTADAIDQYVAAFGASKATADQVIELRYYRADILCFRLAKPEAAGDEWLAVGRSAPVGKFHKEALLAAMNAFEKARPKDTAGRRQLYPVDKKFGEAIDLYATLFPADNKLVDIIFKNGQMFYDYGEYDEAIKRFGLIVTKYPKDDNAQLAGERILAALNKAADYENIENWARKLKTAPSFADKKHQDDLARYIVESIQKSGDKYADAGKFDKAATFYLRVPKETGDARVAAQAMTNAAVMYQKAHRPEEAADIFLDLAQRYHDKAPELAEKAAFSAGQVYEQVIYYDRAAKAYELVIKEFGKTRSERVADAVFNAGVLRQALGQTDKAIEHYRYYAEHFPTRKDAADVAFNIGVVYEEAGQDGPASKAFSEYAASRQSAGKRIVEAHTRAGRAWYRLGQLKKAKEQFVAAQALWKRATGAAKAEGKTWAAEARYYEGELIFRDYEKVSLDVKPSQLTTALTKKTKLLADAEKIYYSIADFNDLKWATAALYRDGQIYDLFATALGEAAAKCPAGLKPDECQAYQDAINDKVVGIQKVAIQRFTIGYDKALKLQNYDDYTAKIREALGRLDAQQFPPEREARAKVRAGDRPPSPELVTEVAR